MDVAIGHAIVRVARITRFERRPNVCHLAARNEGILGPDAKIVISHQEVVTYDSNTRD